MVVQECVMVLTADIAFLATFDKPYPMEIDSILSMPWIS